MSQAEYFVSQLVAQLQHWNGMHSVYAFAAVLITYIFILFTRSNMSA